MMNNPIILLYHSIDAPGSDIGANLYCVSKENFKQQIEYISHCVNRKKIIPTFDDGDISNYKNAYPIIKDSGIMAYFFILVSKINEEGYMSWEHIKQLKDNGMIIGSHGMFHKILTELSEEELTRELKDSKNILEEKLGITIDYFSIPFGFYNAKIIEQAKKAGYKGIFTSDYIEKDGYEFGRIAVRKNWNLNYFKRVISNGLSFKDKTRELFKSSTKKILGAKKYQRIREGILKK